MKVKQKHAISKKIFDRLFCLIEPKKEIFLPNDLLLIRRLYSFDKLNGPIMINLEFLILILLNASINL